MYSPQETVVNKITFTPSYKKNGRELLDHCAINTTTKKGIGIKFSAFGPMAKRVSDKLIKGQNTNGQYALYR